MNLRMSNKYNRLPRMSIIVLRFVCIDIEQCNCLLFSFSLSLGLFVYLSCVNLCLIDKSEFIRGKKKRLTRTMMTSGNSIRSFSSSISLERRKEEEEVIRWKRWGQTRTESEGKLIIATEKGRWWWLGVHHWHSQQQWSTSRWIRLSIPVNDS